MKALLIDGVKYTLRAYEDEDELEGIVEEHARDIFGPDCLYFNLKRRISSRAGVISIPDGYVLDFPQSSWYVVEVELSSHPLHDHIVPQVSKFVSGLDSASTRARIVGSLYDQTSENPLLMAEAKAQVAPAELYKSLSDLLGKDPTLVIVIDEVSPELAEVVKVLPLETRVVEVQTFEREGVGLAVHAHLFEPIYEVGVRVRVPSPPPPPRPPSLEVKAPRRTPSSAEGYGKVLAKLEDLGRVTKAAIGRCRTCYSLRLANGEVRTLWLRYSKQHRSGQYWLGFSKGIHEELLGRPDPFVILVMGEDAENVMVIPANVSHSWLRDSTLTKGGSWELTVWPRSGGGFEIRIGGKPRFDATQYLNGYHLLGT